MAKNLVIVESPAKAKTIAKFLGKDYTIRASFGHIRDLPEKELGVNVDKKFEPKYVNSKDKAKVVKELTTLASKADMVWIATDEDREGEAIGWHLLSVLKISNNKDYQRIVFHEITEDAIKAAIKSPRKIDTNLVDSQQARRVLDRLVGYKLSPLLWAKIRKGLSAGRVQSVAVRLIVEREREILNFIPEEYWNVKANLKSPSGEAFTAELEKISGKGAKVGNESEVNAVLKDIASIKEYLVHDLVSKEAQQTPAAPFTTSTLQQEAARKLGFSVKQTMLVAQQLYEGIEGTEWGGLITYMRTDSTNLAATALKSAKEVIENLYGKEYALKTPRRYQTKTKGAQEAHEAIRPTNLALRPEEVHSALDANQFRLYKLIWERTVACQMAPAILQNTTAKLHPAGQEKYEFVARGKTITFPGYMKLYIEDSDDPAQALENKETFLPELKKEDECTLNELLHTQHFTKPPARYTEASLVKKLESEGIGRPSTYAPTISTIQTRGYVEKEQKALYPTETGFLVTDFLVEHFPSIVDYKFTANVEEKFDLVAQGKIIWHKMIAEFYEPFAATLQTKQETIQKKVEMTEEICPDCGKNLVIRMSKYGKFMACSGYPRCKYSKSLETNVPATSETETPVKATGEKCPECAADLVIRKGRFGQFMACSNYPKCKFTKPMFDPKTGVTCPTCGKGEMLQRRTKKGRTFFACSTYPECKFAVWNRPVQEKCPKCGGMMLDMNKNLKCASCEETMEKPEGEQKS